MAFCPLFSQIGNIGRFMETLFTDQGITIDYVAHQKCFMGFIFRGSEAICENHKHYVTISGHKAIQMDKTLTTTLKVAHGWQACVSRECAESCRTIFSCGWEMGSLSRGALE